MSKPKEARLRYRELLARYELALYKTFDPALGELCAQRQALQQAGVDTKALHSLFAFDYGALEPHVYRLVRADFVFSRRFPGIRYMQKRFDQYAELFTAAQLQQLVPALPSRTGAYWQLANRPAATRYMANVSSDDGLRVWHVERTLALMQAHFAKPDILTDPLTQRTALLRLANLLAATRHYAPQLADRLEANGAPVLLSKAEAFWAVSPLTTAEQYSSPRAIWGNL